MWNAAIPRLTRAITAPNPGWAVGRVVGEVVLPGSTVVVALITCGVVITVEGAGVDLDPMVLTRRDSFELTLILFEPTPGTSSPVVESAGVVSLIGVSGSVRIHLVGSNCPVCCRVVLDNIEPG